MDAELKELLRLSVNCNKMYVKFRKSNNNRQSAAQQEVSVRVSEMNDTKVKIRTGFCSLSEMYAYICVICNRDLFKLLKPLVHLPDLKSGYCTCK